MDKRQKSIGLEPLTGKVNDKRPIFGFDVETVHEERLHKGKKYIHQNFYMGSVVWKYGAKIFYDRRQMQDFLLGRLTMGGIIAATNLEFDWNQLFRSRIKDFHLIYNNRLIAAIHKKKTGNITRKWTMVDTMNYFPRSLKVLGEIVGIKKLDKPACFEDDNEWGIISRKPETEQEKKELEQYNLNDSLITYRFMETFRDFCCAHNMRMKLTIASTGMDYWRRNHQQHTMWREPEEQLKKHFLGSFRGGRTEVYKRGRYDGKLWYYDYRSSYPAVMVKGTDGKGSYPDPSSWHRIKKSSSEMIEDHDGICFASIKAPYIKIPPIGAKINGKLLFPYGNFDGWFTNHELRCAMDNGYEVNPGEMIYYTRQFKPFKEAVNYLYRLRKKYKLEKHVFENMVKLIMNSGLFGKWGMNWQNMEEIVPMDRVKFDNEGFAVIDGTRADGISISNMSEGFDSFAVRKCSGSAPRYSFPVLSSYTTMLARMKLWSDTYKKHDRLVYQDTDSAVMTAPVLEEGNNLGDWELEHVSSGGIFIRPKLYMLNVNGNIISKSKGMKNIAFDREKNCNDETAFIRSIQRGSARLTRFTRMKESQRMNIASGSIINVIKNIGLEDDKRLWKNSFSLDEFQDSEPLRLIDGMPEKEYMIKLNELKEKAEKQKLKDFIRSDKFDRHAAGADISYEDFIDNERWFALRE